MTPMWLIATTQQRDFSAAIVSWQVNPSLREMTSYATSSNSSASPYVPAAIVLRGFSTQRSKNVSTVSSVAGKPI